MHLAVLAVALVALWGTLSSGQDPCQNGGLWDGLPNGECSCNPPFTGSTCGDVSCVGVIEGTECPGLSDFCTTDQGAYYACPWTCGICPCDMDPPACQNGGTFSSCACTCPTGYVGEHCESTCQNGGLSDGQPNGVCNCNPPFYGDTCQDLSCVGVIEAPECPGLFDFCTTDQAAYYACPWTCGICPCNKDPTSCQNGGNFSSCACTCPTGYAGEQCEFHCQNGGLVDDGVCRCLPGWTGDSCETLNCVDFFEDASCLGGAALCDPAVAGSEVVIPLCLVTCRQCNCTKGPASCQNGGTFNAADCTCQCTAGYMGDRCEDTCTKDPNMCQNGGTFSNCACTCPFNYLGEQCEFTCHNGGLADNGVCNCPSGWTGPYCETLNCVDYVEDPFCAANAALCDPTMEGSEVIRPLCLATCGQCNCTKGPASCQNGGTFNAADCTCQCAAGYMGERCEAFDCQNGGVPILSEGKCSCLPYYSGNFCEELICRAAYDDETCADFEDYCDVSVEGSEVIRPLCPIRCSVDGCTCATDKCKNGGILVDSTCRCQCPPLYTGVFCDQLDCTNAADIGCDELGDWSVDVIGELSYQNGDETITESCSAETDVFAFLRPLCPYHCGVCTCSKVCQNGGTLDHSLCTCTCPLLATGVTCETAICPQDEQPICGQLEELGDVDCSDIPNVQTRCPRLCGVCGPGVTATTTTTTPAPCLKDPNSCQHSSTLNLVTCSCDCRQDWTGEFCETRSCAPNLRDPTPCLEFADCTEVPTQIAYLCPRLCGVCPNLCAADDPIDPCATLTPGECDNPSTLDLCKYACGTCGIQTTTTTTTACATIECQNGGTFVDCACACLSGFTGVGCSERDCSALEDAGPCENYAVDDCGAVADLCPILCSVPCT